MLLLVFLFLLLVPSAYVFYRVFRAYEKTTEEKNRRLFELEKKERAVELERGLRLKKQAQVAREIRRAGSGYRKLHQEFPSYAPTSEKYQAYNRIMAEIRDKKEREGEEDDDLAFLRGK